ncbi:hypothetical protein N474_19500 [Pseudoalteromonas luteoviolacea CPMOR-2]|uniref:DUF3015 domain-containing protein n=1 Tax=Pseudoalteromonas luteoviolacea DSM 6061 TaxID=1365250 RepID=A0A166VSY0_9GAMM|nr:DUF3015 family protein [Pseudoalteromonas luteoviolacea]KZN33667.1 hypothetical protein N475_20040 [Pseudoalteromonas luteoviolacea DSM 6061]KZN53759.1 hypothetical protein N474_19500 [Pseudoalteromonas luteoviolacea CPMOR-2]MBE0389581.1 hypothetical protein [Pseudoalteromonas luteoviolacea DSM 6061]
MNKKLLLAAATALTFAANANAEGPNPFSDCGIGAALFPDNSTLAVTSNIIWDIGTTAVTSATMSPETCSVKETEVAKFIIESYDSLNEDTARGEGQHLNALLDIAEVSAEQKDEVVAKLRSNVAVSMVEFNAETTKVEKSQAYYTALMTAI